MKRLIDILFSRKKLVVLIFGLIFAYGIYSFLVIPKQEMPEIDTPYMIMSIIAPSVSASEIEDTIIKDVEKLILTYEDVDSVRSTIYDNYAVIITLYSYSTVDPDLLSTEIYEKVNELSLNDNISEISYSSNFDDPHIIFAVHSDQLSAEELINYGEQFKNELMLFDEISVINIDSVFSNEVIITLDTNLLSLYGLTINDIYGILYANSLDIPLGGLSSDIGSISISGNTEIDSLEIFENMIIIPEIEGISPEVILGDISTIELKDTSNKIFEYNDDSTIFLSLFFKSDIDFTKMGNDIIEAKKGFIDEVNDPLLEIDELLFLPDYVNAQINNVFFSLFICIVVVMIIVLIGLGFRSSLLIIITIPLIIFTSIAILFLGKYELHKLTIVGLIIAIGILVDNSIVITEGIKRNLDSGMYKTDAAKKAIHDNFAPVLSSTLTTIAAFIVLVMLPGFLGEIVSSLPLTVIIAISLSYIVSMVLSPVLATLFLKKSKAKKVKKTSIHEYNIKKMIGFTIRFPLVWISVSILLLIGSVYFAFTNQKIDLYPNDERSVLYIDFLDTTGYDLWSTELLGSEIKAILDDEEHIISYASSIGGDLPNFHFSANFISEQKNVGRIYVNLDFNESDLLKYKTELENSLKSIENSVISVNLLELSPPIPPVRLSLRSDETSTLDVVSTNIFNEIIDLNSVKTFFITQNVKSLKYIIAYDFESISNSFLTKAQIDEVIAINLNGFDLDIFSYNNETINVSLNSDVLIVEDLLNLTIYSDILDEDILLSNFISIISTIDYSVINRLDGKGVSYIGLYFEDFSSLNDLNDDVVDIVDNSDLNGVEVIYGGENDMFEEITEDLIRASLIALVIIYIIMFVQFNNFVKPLIVFLTIPLSFSGSFLFLIIFNSPITATSLVGMVSLLGVTVNTGILLVEYISRSHNNGCNINEACIEAVFLRFRPIMLTSITTILGLIPLLITGGNFFKPMAISFMGGMVTSTIFTIFLIPSVYYLIYKKK